MSYILVLCHPKSLNSHISYPESALAITLH